MIKILIGTMFGVFFVSPAISGGLEKVDFSPLNELFQRVGLELLKMGLDAVQSVI